jgi:hypothetical protein
VYKKVEDIFSSADGNRSVQQPAPQIVAQEEPKKSYNQMTDAEAIRAMGDKLSAIWGSK